ncbi:hypothetical protein BRC60_00835 [Halobacteriales archaeon QH_1_68_42]|nr:MAG: hypothetical protein BRC60_00835 [Halobacteriales archaeon QH_1_68_42]
MLETVGFEHAGRFREDFYVDGEYVDADLYDLLASEWDGPRHRSGDCFGVFEMHVPERRRARSRTCV